jgi:hypothetical protein
VRWVGGCWNWRELVGRGGDGGESVHVGGVGGKRETCVQVARGMCTHGSRIL